MTRWPRNRAEENRIRRKKRRREAGCVEHRNYVSGKNEDSTPRTPIILCKVCGGQPWARIAERGDEYTVAYPPGLGVPGCGVPVCRGCGQPYAPERAAASGPAVSSSAGMALRI